jgi:hypothetical protein
MCIKGEGISELVGLVKVSIISSSVKHDKIIDEYI